MSKKKKTLKQKKLADLRLLQSQHEAIQQSTPTISYTFSGNKNPIMTPTYSLQHDIKKTLGVSLGILVFLFVLSSLLQSRMFMLPLISLR